MAPHQKSERIIYLADDDEDDRMLFTDAVEELDMGFIVQSAVDGKELLDALAAEKRLPEAVFLDINMPCKNGFDCLKEIRNWKGKLQQVKIIMLSTSSSSLHITRSYKMGADYYAVKPTSFKDLKELLKKMLDQDFKSIRKGMKKIQPA
ncbi:response regulator [Flavobacterium sp. ACN6]|uniref:response regulator n=1 Tax=Flavobacterium sp. ACN6 TaxID=1920426 RepID=UPI000BB2F6BC|nr:response regulator [Flavobacterium sp. ACN6]PBJ05619.1 Transcriptional regulatory protein PrrA [Flavobacterium sp. ACN6]